MAVPLTQIAGKVLLPNGSTAAGTITATLSQPGSVLDGAVSQTVAAQSAGTIAADGSVTLSLVPNDAIVPAGTAYRVVMRYGSAVVEETWQLASTPDPVDIGAILRVSSGGVTFVAGPTGPTGPTGPQGPAGPAGPSDFMVSWLGAPIASEVLYRVVLAHAVTIPAGATDSRAVVGTNPTASFVVSIQKNGVEAGTLTIATNGTATFAVASPIALVAGDRLSLVAPATADATLADLSITLVGTPA